MQIFYALIALLVTLHAQAATLEGKDSSGQPCQLVVEKFETESGTPEWYSLQMTVRTNWQLAGNPSILLKPSFTPYSLYGINKETRDQVAVSFAASEVPALENVISFSFQTWDAERGLLQTYCRINRE